MKWRASQKREPQQAETSPSAIKKVKHIAQVDVTRASPRNPAASNATASAAAVLSAAASPPSPSQPSAVPAGYPQRGQPAQTPQQTLPTIPELHEGTDHCLWPAAAARRARGGSPPSQQHEQAVQPSKRQKQQQQQQRRRQEERQQQGQEQGQMSHLAPAPDLDLATADDAEQRHLQDGNHCPVEQHSGRAGNPAAAAGEGGPRQRRRLDSSTSGHSWVESPPQQMPAGPGAALSPELQLLLHAQLVHQPRPGFPGWAVVPYSPSSPLLQSLQQQQQQQQQQAMSGAADQWLPHGHHNAQQELHYQVLQAQQQQQAALDGQQQSAAESDTAMMLVADEQAPCPPPQQPLAQELSGGLDGRRVSLEHLAGAVLSETERHGSGGSGSGGLLEQRLSGGLHASLSASPAPPGAQLQQGLPAAAVGLQHARFCTAVPAGSYGSIGGGDSMED